MKLASLPDSSKDGKLIVVSPDGARGALAPQIPSLRAAIEDWGRSLQILERVADFNIPLAGKRLLSPLPRTWSFLDGSAFIRHIELVRKARGAEMPEDLRTVPLMYQGISDGFLAPQDDILFLDKKHGLDFEAEVAVVLDETPIGTTAEDAEKHIKLLVLLNDISLRNLIPRELNTGFGFVQSKPASSFAPFAVTPDECKGAWKDGRLHLEMRSTFNGALFGRPNAGEMFFSFHRLIEHAARTRTLPAGTIIGSGTVSNEDASLGSGCLAEKRMLEIIETGSAKTPFMKDGDRIEIEMLQDGVSFFGKISQKAVLLRDGRAA